MKVINSSQLCSLSASSLITDSQIWIWPPATATIQYFISKKSVFKIYPGRPPVFPQGTVYHSIFWQVQFYFQLLSYTKWRTQLGGKSSTSCAILFSPSWPINLSIVPRTSPEIFGETLFSNGDPSRLKASVHFVIQPSVEKLPPLIGNVHVWVGRSINHNAIRSFTDS